MRYRRAVQYEYSQSSSVIFGLTCFQSLSSRTIRVSIAEPREYYVTARHWMMQLTRPTAKERSGFGGGFEDDTKFDNPWRRDGPLPDLPGAGGDRDGSRRGPGGGPPPPSVAEGVDQWRSSRPPRLTTAPDSELPVARRKGSGFATPEGQVGLADTEEKWSKGTKFTPSGSEDNPGSRFGTGFKPRSEMGPPKDPPAPSVAEGESDWRSSSRPKPVPRASTSRRHILYLFTARTNFISLLLWRLASNSTPSTPQLTRRKLELIPRSNSGSASPTPLSSPKMASSTTPSSRSNPFGAAKYVV